MRTRLIAPLLAALLAPAAPAAPRPHYVVDARLAALRSGPALTAPLLKRLRVGRRVYEFGRRVDRDGRAWLRVAVTRRTRGWMLEDALARPGDPRGERRLAALVGDLRGLPRLEVARVAADHFPRLRAAAAEALREEAIAEADELAERANRRLGPLEGATPDEVRALLLSDPALDRYNRLGVFFDADPATRRYVPLGARPPAPARAVHKSQLPMLDSPVHP
jgi:hypothetical protein